MEELPGTLTWQGMDGSMGVIGEQFGGEVQGVLESLLGKPVDG